MTPSLSFPATVFSIAPSAGAFIRPGGSTRRPSQGYGGFAYGYGRGFYRHHFSDNDHNWGPGSHHVTSSLYATGTYHGSGSSGGFHSGATTGGGHFGGSGGGFAGGGFHGGGGEGFHGGGGGAGGHGP